MAKGYGNLLLTEDGLETAHIPEADRERVVVEFYSMKSEAERRKDRFYMLSSVYGHVFSYGTFYQNFCNMSWDEFQKHQSLKGISQRAFDLMQGFYQNPNIASLNDEATFTKKDEPRAHAGYSNPQAYPVFVGDKTAWEQWHQQWYTAHPTDIDWSEAINDWLPRPDLVLEILKRELLSKFIADCGDEEFAKNKLASIAEETIVHEFHGLVMAHKGDALEGYASKIGGEICRCNYYTFEKELSSLEHQKADSLREIYSIVNRNGKRQFISIDFGHGMFEFHNEKGEHQGEFRFDGSYNSPIEIDHGFKCMEQWHKQTGR